MTESQFDIAPFLDQDEGQHFDRKSLFEGARGTNQLRDRHLLALHSHEANSYYTLSADLTDGYRGVGRGYRGVGRGYRGVGRRYKGVDADTGELAMKTLEHHIEITPSISGGKPRIAGHRITVEIKRCNNEASGIDSPSLRPRRSPCALESSVAEVCERYIY